MPKKIQPKKRLPVYLQDHREHLKDRANPNLTQEEVARRLGTTGMTVSRWETGEVLMTTDTMAAVCEAMRAEAIKVYGHPLIPEDLYHSPNAQTPNQLLRDQPSDVVDAAMKMLNALRK